jgi:hypothetical protein
MLSGRWVAAASPQGDIALWDWRRAVAASTGQQLGGHGGADGSGGGHGGGAHGGASSGMHSITSHRALLSALALHPLLPRLASGSRNQFIKLFDIHALREGGAAKEVT